MEVLFIGFAAVFVHVVSGADHMAALAPFAARREQQAAWRLGLQWGLGHAGGVALIGLLVWLLKGTAAAEWLSSGAEWHSLSRLASHGSTWVWFTLGKTAPTKGKLGSLELRDAEVCGYEVWRTRP